MRELKKMGVKVVGKEIFVTADCRIAGGATLYSPCYITGATVVEGGCVLLPGCNINASKIYKNCTLGPWCNLRGGCTLLGGCRVGDFVELKNCTLGEGAKAAHLSYIGDATLGRGVNVGCGVVFANYNGKEKKHTKVGDGVFIGCNSVIIAPAQIGDGAYIAAGTVVSGELPAQSFALSRPSLVVKPEGGKGRYHG